MKFQIILFSVFALTCNAAKEADICYPNLGCFTSDYPWGGTPERPLEYVPEHPSTIKTRFYLDTRYQLDVEVYNTDANKLLHQTSFDPTKNTKWIIHGYVQNGDVNWMNYISDEFLILEDCNVIRVGWFAGSLDVNYARSATNIQVVAAEIGYFMEEIALGSFLSVGENYCIGHSLGAHACSYINYRYPVERITGLDPAGPYFEGTPTVVRLDASDAPFVDVIHSDADKIKNLGMGTNQISGHIDFWPNNGKEQPGCDQNALSTIVGIDGIVEGSRNFVACNHMRATGFFVESIRSNCGFSSNPCTSYQAYLDGDCNQCPNGVCSSMGYQSIFTKDIIANSGQVNYYLKTSTFSPYCLTMTYVDVQLGIQSDGIKGVLYLALYGDNEQSTELVPLFDEDQEYDLRPGNIYSYAGHFTEIPANFYYVKFLWDQLEYTLYTQYMTIDHVKIWMNDGQEVYYFCDNQSVLMKETTRYVLTRC